MLDADRATGKLTEVREAAYGYLALSLDKSVELQLHVSSSLECLSSRSRCKHCLIAMILHSVGPTRRWLHLIVGLGYDWVIGQTAKCIDELVALVRPEANGGSVDMFDGGGAEEYAPPPITITCKPADSLDHIADGSIDRGGHGPALLRQRHVRRAVGLLLCLAQAHRRACLPRALPSAPDRQGQ